MYIRPTFCLQDSNEYNELLSLYLTENVVNIHHSLLVITHKPKLKRQAVCGNVVLVLFPTYPADASALLLRPHLPLQLEHCYSQNAPTEGLHHFLTHHQKLHAPGPARQVDASHSPCRDRIAGLWLIWRILNVEMRLAMHCLVNADWLYQYAHHRSRFRQIYHNSKHEHGLVNGAFDSAPAGWDFLVFPLPHADGKYYLADPL